MSTLLFCGLGLDGSHDVNGHWSIMIVNNGESCGLFSLLQYSFLFVPQSVRPTVTHFFTTYSSSSYQEVKRVPRPVGSERKICVVYAISAETTFWIFVSSVACCKYRTRSHAARWCEWSENTFPTKLFQKGMFVPKFKNIYLKLRLLERRYWYVHRFTFEKLSNRVLGTRIGALHYNGFNTRGVCTWWGGGGCINHPFPYVANI